MQTIKIGSRNLTPAEKKEIENIAAESQAAPDGAYRYFVHNPLDKTTLYYRSEALQQQAAAAILRSCCVEGDWDEAAVAQIAMGVVTHTPQRVLLQTEPQPADYADASAYTQAHDAWEEDCDADGEVWTYRMLPLAAPGAGQERRPDTTPALDVGVWRQIATESRYKAAPDGWVRATLPFCDRHGERLQYFFRQEGETYLLSDDGKLVRDLQAGGHLSADARGWRQSLAAKLADFGVELNGNALYMCCDAGQFPHKFGDYLHALLVVAGPAFTLTSATEEQP
ncbi:DUF1828 domain-containing protein [Cardiobacterium valvarum]|uniref:DUF1828 domain-containing protein n=1 Tax=Cardiobacterium valvarum F0432 TaxID=797473 RepID=G9ZIP2_9GAMM|nr:DUF1828 domain-containing protein [Cardiobacterium valvarum]EHM51680.1 hypothetical protein HMPREF9080_02653 [Cardiobacterium valvarum F0432]